MSILYNSSKSINNMIIDSPSYSSSLYEQLDLQNLKKSNSNDKEAYVDNLAQLEYAQYFGPLLNKIDKIKIQSISKETLRHHKIKILDENDYYWGQMINYSNTYAEHVKSKFHGLECLYEVIIGRFYLIVNVLNLNRNASDEKQKQSSIDLGKGSNGVVKLANVEGTKIAVKHLFFHKYHKRVDIPGLTDPTDMCSPYEIRQAIKEYCIYKICSMLKIGPQIIFNNVYDIVCYNDGIEFHMELCETVHEEVTANYQEDIKQCVATLHSFNFVHKDIKPANTLYSPSLQKYVLSDFGIAHPVKQKIGMKTETYFQGTEHFASNQMKALLYTKTTGLVDLFYNDMHSLKVTSSRVKTPNNKNDSADNSQSYSHHEFSNIQREYSESQNQSMSYTQKSEVATDKNSLPNTGTDSSYQSDLTKDVKLKSLQINFYLMKVLYRLLVEGPLKETTQLQLTDQASMLQLIDEAVQQICQCEGDEYFLQRVTQMTKNLLCPTNPEIFAVVTSVRNIVRTFGYYSEQFTDKLNQIIKSSSFKFIDVSELKQISQSISKDINAFRLKNLSNVCLDIDRHYRLTNGRVFFKQIKYVVQVAKNRGNLRLSRLTKKNLIANLIFMVEVNQFQDEQISDLYKTVDFIISSESQQSICKIPRRIFVNTTLPEQIISKNTASKIATVKYKFIKYVYETCKNSNFYSKGTELQIFRTLVNLGYPQISEEYFYPQMQDQFELLEASYQNLKADSYWSCSFFETLIIHLQILELLKKHKDAYEIAARNFENVKTSNLGLFTCGVLDKFYFIFFNNKQYELAEWCNERSFSLMKQFYFPKEDYIRSSNYYKNKGRIQIIKGFYDLASNNLEKSLYIFTESMIEEKHFSLIDTYSMLVICYDYLKDLKNVQRCLKILVRGTYDDKAVRTEKKLKFLGNLIKLRIKECKKLNMNNYFDLFIETKMQLTREFDTSEFCSKFFRQVPAFNLNRQNHLIDLDQEALIYSKRMLVQSIEKYLPVFLCQYRSLCQQIACFYLQQNVPSKALPFLWNYFQKFALYSVSGDKIYYAKAEKYVNLLIYSNSSRKAFKFLQSYAYKIPDQFSELKESAFKRIHSLSRSLGLKNCLLYQYINRYQACCNFSSFDACENSISKINSDEIKLPIKMAYLKKLAALKPAIIQDNINQVTSTYSDIQLVNTAKKCSGIKIKRKQNKYEQF